MTLASAVVFKFVGKNVWKQVASFVTTKHITQRIKSQKSQVSPLSQQPVSFIIAECAVGACCRNQWSITGKRHHRCYDLDKIILHWKITCWAHNEKISRDDIELFLRSYGRSFPMTEQTFMKFPRQDALGSNSRKWLLWAEFPLQFARENCLYWTFRNGCGPAFHHLPRKLLHR